MYVDIVRIRAVEAFIRFLIELSKYWITSYQNQSRVKLL